MTTKSQQLQKKLDRERRTRKQSYPKTEDGKRQRQRDFEYCMDYIAASYSSNCEKIRGLNNLRPKLTLLDVKILETGLKQYKERLDKEIEYCKKDPSDLINAEIIGDIKTDQIECDKILKKLEAVQEPIFNGLTEYDINSMYAHRLTGIGYWTSGCTIN